jgi:phosphatidylinositol 4-kinase A
MQQVLQCGKPQNLYEEYKRIQAEEDVWTYLTICAKESSVFLNQLIWMLEVSLFNPTENLEKTLGNKYYHIILEVIKENIEEWDQFNLEQKYFEKFLLISSTLVPKSPENTNIINQELQKLSKNIPEGLYIPTNPNKYVIGLRDDNGRPLQSAKRTPILVTFYTKSKDDDETDTTQCIFKVNDDVRNDQLCLQVIDLMKEILYQANLKIYLRPYKVISTITHTNDGPQLSGIIECIPNCKSRDEIGKEGIQSLYTYFIDKFGQETSDGYIEAKKNFIASLAGYAIASYMLQIKDRHNGNILIDEFGHIVHIDFGFILNISPGGNMRFERPGFKLTQEMIDVMGKSDTESFEYFKSLVTKGYLAIREHAYSFIAIVSKMEFSGLTCFRKGAVNNFIKRFYLKFSLPEAIKKINEKISRANNSFFTLWYDRIQLMQQQIEY